MLKCVYNNFIICISLILCSFQMSCKDVRFEDSYDIILETRDFNYQVPELNKIKTFIERDLLPRVTENEKKELNDFISIIKKALDQKETFFDNAPEFAKLVKGNAKTAIILYNYVSIDDLNVQLRIPSSLLISCDTLKMLEDPDSQEFQNIDFSRDIAFLKKKSLELAEKTLSRFPDEGRAYGQVGFVLARTGGNRTKALQMYRRCIDLDKDADFCRDGYNAFQKNITN